MPFFHDDVLDNGPKYIKDNCNKVVLCSAEPTTFAEANATFALADVAVATGDFTMQNGVTSGRRCSMAAKAAVTVDTPGAATHTAYLDTTTSKLLGQRALASSQAIAGSVDIGAHDVHESLDPTAV